MQRMNERIVVAGIGDCRCGRRGTELDALHRCSRCARARPRRRARLAPVEVVERVEHAQVRPSAERVSCPTCNKLFAGGSVVTVDHPHRVLRRSGMQARAEEGGAVMGKQRCCHCDHCSHVFVWAEAIDSRGKPNGVVLGPVDIIKRRQDVEFMLRHYPQMQGVLQ